MIRPAQQLTDSNLNKNRSIHNSHSLFFAAKILHFLHYANKWEEKCRIRVFCVRFVCVFGAEQIKIIGILIYTRKRRIFMYFSPKQYFGKQTNTIISRHKIAGNRRRIVLREILGEVWRGISVIIGHGFEDSERDFRRKSARNAAKQDKNAKSQTFFAIFLAYVQKKM